MALGQGTVFTASEVKNQLREANKNHNLWTQAYNNIKTQTSSAYDELSKQYNTSSANLTSQYSKTLLDTYKAAFSQKRAIENSSIGQGYKDLALSENDEALRQAYDSYRASYLGERTGLEQSAYSSAQSIANSAASATAEVDKTLDEQSQMMADYGNAHMEYLEWLYENNPDQFYDEDQLIQQMLAVKNMTAVIRGDVIGDELTDEQKEHLNELGPTFAKYLNNGEFDFTYLTSLLFDADGNLTEEGIKYFELIDEYSMRGGKYSFGNYLAAEKPELLDWGSSRDDFVYGGQNFKTFQALTGRGPYADREK